MAEDLNVSGALNGGGRSARVKAHLDGQLRELSGLFADPDTAGRKLARRYSQLMDELLRTLFQSAHRDGPTPAVLFAAVGGYGRELLGWKSDIDVRFLTRSEPERLQELAEGMLYPLWDAGISIGHQVITPAQASNDALTDLPTATALLDFRPICGDLTLEPLLKQRAFAGVFSTGRLAEFIGRLRAEAAGRHQRLHDSVYLLEPDVKNGAGGLRDLDLAQWAAVARWQTADPHELQRLGVLVAREAEEIGRACEFLWSVRNRLHRAAGRRSDRLTFGQQETIARDLGYRAKVGAAPGTSDEQNAGAMAEAFMQDYYRHARVITRASEQLLDRATPRMTNSPLPLTDLGRGLRMYGDSITLSDSAALRNDPALAMRLFATALGRKCPVLSEARDAVARESADPSFGAALRQSREAAQLFVRMLVTSKHSPFRTESVLTELHDVGLLVAMIPEFSPVVGRAHHDVYHVFTVDVHSVAAVDHLRALLRGDLSDKQPLASRLIHELPRREVLFLAALLHDIGKAVRGKDHARRGAEMARGILVRLGLSAIDVEEVSRLVREHLTMYLVAMRRDLEDPRTVSEFASRVQGRGGLTALYLLTVADLCTTSPTSMTRWKSSMLESLFRATDRLLGGDPPFDHEQLQRLREDAARHWDPGLPERFLHEFCDSMPERYLLTNTSAEIAAHAKVALEGRGEAVTAAIVPSRHPDVAELCVVTEGKPAEEAGLCVVAGDRPGLLAAITAALAANRLDIYAAQIHSRKLAGGALQAVDLFWVRDRIEGASGVDAVLPKLRRDLRNVITGGVNPRELLSTRKPPRWSVRPSPKVSTEVLIDNAEAPAHTVIEVFAKDQAGVLFAIAQAMHDLGLTIAVAKVSTEGERAADVFYVTEADGRKLESEERIEEVRRALLSALEPVTALHEGQA
ncbi:MAG TPA: [protein-PII] uridylyltransferase [Polyangiales bacterium]|nr:[protein-PII] uridylyltransferase [Polyangiales bacterium]